MYPDSKLYRPRRPRGGQSPERGIGGAGVRGGKHRMIERVHKFRAELHVALFAKARILHSRKLALDDARRANSRKQRIRIEDSHPPVTACYDQAHLKAIHEMGDAKF